MKPHVDACKFGQITLDGKVYRYDVVIELDGRVRRRNKRLSRNLYGTSHKLSLDEAKDVYQKGAERLLIGSGRYGSVVLSKKAAKYFNRKGCKVSLTPTKKAAKRWNKARRKTLGLFHITC
jgi:hypothetical protein